MYSILYSVRFICNSYAIFYTSNLPLNYTSIQYLIHATRRYNPQRDNSNAPSLSKGWAYFEHFTLPRRFESKSGGHHIRAPPGEAKHTRLYGAFMTPQESLSGKRYICGRLMC